MLMIACYLFRQNQREAHCLKNILPEYCELNGHAINLDNSNGYFGGVVYFRTLVSKEFLVAKGFLVRYEYRFWRENLSFL